MQKGTVFKVLSNLLVLLSLLFLVIYLIENKKIIWLDIQNIPYFILSIFFILFGFIFESIALRFYLKKDSIELTFKQSIIATGKYILAKYIPGKIGILIGKTTYITGYCQVSPLRVFQKIFIFQIFILLGSFLISIFPLYTFLSVKTDHFIWILLIILVLLILFTNSKFQSFFLKLFEKILNKELGTTIPTSTLLPVLLILILCYLFWSLGFYLLALSLGFKLALNVGFLFPLAALIGVITLIAPGGLGIREGVIVAGLIYYNVPKELAISLSAFSRIWFLVGELLIFFISLLLSVKRKNKRNLK